jgi:hypothetical protein
MTWNLGKVGLCAFAATAAFACAKNTHDTSVGKAPTDHAMAQNATLAEPIDQGKPDHHQGEKPSEHAIGGGPTDTHSRFSSSITKIASARCDREMKCGNVGPNEKFPSRSECVAKVSVDKGSDISTDECSLGISTTGLNDCLKAIRDEDCGNPLDSVKRLNVCRTGNLCLK